MTATDALPWDALKLPEDRVPWQTLEAFADAAADKAEVRTRLLSELRHHLDRRYAGDHGAETDLTDLAVPAVFALAASRLDEAGRREAATALLELLYRAGEEQDEWQVEVLMYTASHLGGPAAEEALKAIETGGWDAEAFFHLFGVLRNTAREADAPTRERIIRHCRHMVATSPKRGSRWTPGFAPANILAVLRDVESMPLLKQLYDESHSGDIEDSIKEMTDAAEAAKWDEFEFDNIRPHRWVPGHFKRAKEALLTDVAVEEIVQRVESRLPPVDLEKPAEKPFLANALPLSNPAHPSARVGRNDPCVCGSGRKYKKCCGSGG